MAYQCYPLFRPIRRYQRSNELTTNLSVIAHHALLGIEEPAGKCAASWRAIPITGSDERGSHGIHPTEFGRSGGPTKRLVKICRIFSFTRLWTRVIKTSSSRHGVLLTLNRSTTLPYFETRRWNFSLVRNPSVGNYSLPSSTLADSICCRSWCRNPTNVSDLGL